METIMEHAEAGPVALPQAGSARRAKDEGKVRSEKIRIEQHGATGLLWFAGWLFTIGFLHLPFWKGLLALIVWPYYIGTSIAGVVGG